jgi:hypothetical protein
MFLKVIYTQGFAKSVFYLSIGFIFIYNLVDIGWKFDFDFPLYLQKRFASDNLLRFFVANIGSGLVYGFIITYFKFSAKVKKEQ